MTWWKWAVLVAVSWLVGAVLGVVAFVRMDGIVTDLEKDAAYWRNRATLKAVR